jgi:hypothetical protein
MDTVYVVENDTTGVKAVYRYEDDAQEAADAALWLSCKELPLQ